MLFLIVLFASYAVIWPLTRSSTTRRARWRIALGAGMVVAGAAHLAMPLPFIQHLPEIVPMREAIVFGSGVVEIVLGLALAGPARWRPTVGLVLAAYLVAVFPGNLYVAFSGVAVEGQPGGIYAWLRLPLQGFFIWLAVWSTDGLSALPGRFVARGVRRASIA
jgi:uncharacterized membrane protein